MVQDPAVLDYLASLEAAAVDLDPDRRAELVSEVSEHLDLAIAEAGGGDEATVRLAIERLGPPEEIVAAESGASMLPAGPPERLSGPRWRERLRRPLSVERQALLLMTVGAVMLPVIGPVLGLWVGWASDRWTDTQKRTAALIVGSILTVSLVPLVPRLLAGELTWIISSGSFMFAFVPFAGLAAAVYLVASSSFAVTISRRT